MLLQTPVEDIWSPDAVHRAAAQVDPTAVVEVLYRPEAKIYDLIVDVTPASGPVYQVLRSRSGAALATDGTLEQASAVAAWARSLLPEVLPCNLMIVDQGYNERVFLPWGITPAEVLAGWAPIE